VYFKSFNEGKKVAHWWVLCLYYKLYSFCFGLETWYWYWYCLGIDGAGLVNITAKRHCQRLCCKCADSKIQWVPVTLTFELFASKIGCYFTRARGYSVQIWSFCELALWTCGPNVTERLTGRRTDGQTSPFRNAAAYMEGPTMRHCSQLIDDIPQWLASYHNTTLHIGCRKRRERDASRPAWRDDIIPRLRPHHIDTVRHAVPADVTAAVATAECSLHGYRVSWQ